MKNSEQFRGKRILILGLAKSGLAAAELLHSLGAHITVNDAAFLDEHEGAQALQNLGVKVIGGGHPEALLSQGFDLIVKNPGIPYHNPILKEAMEKKIPIWTEIEIAYQISEAPIIAITGSNGKTTTTTMLYDMLEEGGKKPLIAGNIGTVSCAVAAKATAENLIVLEASSFQLLGTAQFRPRIAILLNLYDAHLDYHGAFSNYQEAKAQITAYQTVDDYLIYNADQPEVVKVAKTSQANKIPFSTSGVLTEGISADESFIYWQGEAIISRDIIQLPGAHNLENILCAIAVSLLRGCEQAAIEKVLTTFHGVKHRMQFVKEVNEVKYYNDSKATNTLATKSALEAFEKPIVLIAGGLDRGHSFEELRTAMKHVKAVVAIGETTERFQAFAASCHIDAVQAAETMADAVKLAASLASSGEIVLLSPASASWDQYSSFEVRGDCFIEAVVNL